LAAKHTLPSGIVCDKCNNYFARKVEKPFLEESSMLHLRFEAGIESKRGIIPPINAVLNFKYPIKIWKDSNRDFAGHIDVDPVALDAILSANKGIVVFPIVTDIAFLKEGAIVSRFVGKIAIEAIAQRILESEYADNLDLFIDDEQFDLLRNHVRRGTDKNWVCSVRRIYDINKWWIDAKTQKSYQVIHEFDFLYTDEKELYFILIILGMEYAINIGGSCMEGYMRWLKIHNGESPLYFGNNLAVKHASSYCNTSLL
jgi:hypothetical protein